MLPTCFPSACKPEKLAAVPGSMGRIDVSVTTQAETRSSSCNHYKGGSFGETLIDHVTYKALCDL